MERIVMEHTQVHEADTTPDICKTLYFWWIAYLRCSADYWWICKEDGRCEDERLHRVWKHFGNVFEYGTLLHYWQERAHHLFDSPQQSFDLAQEHPDAALITLLDPKTVSGSSSDKLYLSVDREQSREAAINAFQKIWDQALITGKRYTQDAPFQLKKLDPKSRSTIIDAYCANVIEDACGKSYSHEPMHRWGGYEKAKFLNILGKVSATAIGTVALAQKSQDRIRALFCSKKTTAQQLIANAEIGLFPCRALVPVTRRWTRLQTRRLKHAISSHEWRPRGWILGEHQFLLPHLDFSSAARTGPSRGDVLSAVQNFSELDSSQLGKP
jgi:hypothetical protein